MMIKAIAGAWQGIVAIALVFIIGNVEVAALEQQSPAKEGAMVEEELLRLGERMYRQGVLPNGKPMQAEVAGDVEVDGRMFTCVNCHQRSGLGSVEGSVITWPVNGRELFVPRRRTGASNPGKRRQGPGAVQRWSLPKQYQAADARPAFGDETLARLLRTGIDHAGEKVMQVMPRYRLDDDDMAVLIHYLKSLSDRPDPGVDDNRIRFATVITEGVSEVDRNAMLSVLKNHIDVHNTQTRPHIRRAKKGPFYKTEGYGAYRKLELDVWELKGPQETWEAQLENYYRIRPVFALLGGIGAGSWKPVHQFCEKHEIPNIFPITDHPVVSDSDWYTLYFDKGLYQEGEAAARFLNAKRMDGSMIQIFKSGGRGEEIARGFEETWKKLGGTGLINKDMESGDDLSSQWMNENISSSPVTTVLIWLEGADAGDLLQSGVFNNGPERTLFVSATLLEGETDVIPGNLRDASFLTHPYSLPGDYERKSKVLKRWLKMRGIPQTNLDIQAKMYFLGWMLPGAIKYMRSEFYRDYFLEGLDMMTDQTYAVAIYPRLSFGPGQRYAAKGCYITQLTNDNAAQLSMTGEWVTN